MHAGALLPIARKGFGKRIATHPVAPTGPVFLPQKEGTYLMMVPLAWSWVTVVMALLGCIGGMHRHNASEHAGICNF